MGGDKVTSIANGQSAIIGAVKVTVPSNGISVPNEGRRSVKLSMMKIADASAVGTSYKAGSTFEAGGKNVTVMSIGQSTALVKVGNDSRTIAIGGEDSVNGVRISIPLGAIGKADDGRRTVSLIVTDLSVKTESAAKDISPISEIKGPVVQTLLGKNNKVELTETVSIGDGKKDAAKSEQKVDAPKTDSTTTTIAKPTETQPAKNVVFTKTVSKGTVIRDIPSLKYGDSIKINGKAIDVYVIMNDRVYLVVGTEGKMIKKNGSSKENTIAGFNVIINSLSYDPKNFRKSSVNLIVTP